MESTDLALRTWMVYCQENALYKTTVSKAVNTWSDTRNTLIKPLLKSLNKKSISKAWTEITAIYKALLKPQTEPITTPDGTYTNWVILTETERCIIYTATLNTEPVIVKTYISVNRDAFVTDENKISQSLYKKGFYVPKRYESFNTAHHLCIPMQKLETTLLDMYVSDPFGIGLMSVKSIVRHFVPILQVIHIEYKKCYVDFSCGNVAFHDNEPYMIDFGALHPTYCSTPCMKTLRYASINAIAGKSVTYMDDLQSLGFLITEALCGPSVVLEKHLVIKNALEGKLGTFLQAYFTGLDSDNPYTSLLSLC